MTRHRLAIVMSMLLAAHHARADNSSLDPLADFADPNAAQNLFVEGRALMQRGDYAEACPKLEESVRLKTNVDAQLKLADCNEHLGKIASAWAGLLDLVNHATTIKDADKKSLTRRAHALESRLPKLVIEVPDAPPGLEVKRDGIALDRAQSENVVFVDPGQHRVTAWRPGSRRWLTTVDCAEGTTTRVRVPADLPSSAGNVIAEAPSPVAPPVAPPVDPTPPELSTTPSPEAPPTGETRTEAPSPSRDVIPFPPPVVEEPIWNRRTLGLIVAGAGVLGIATGTGFGLTSIGKRDEAQSHCHGDVCTATGVGLRSDAMSAGNAATVSMALGAASLAGGLILILTAPKRAEARHPPAVQAVPNAGQNGAGLPCRGAF
jgi:hypothetical protein